jgi:putative transposase/transposase-like zinc-binding protein
VTPQRLEVADVFRQHGQEFLDRWGHTLSRQQRRVLRDIVACRTAELGVHHIEQCDRCPHQKTVYNSCRNRHCPKCHSRARDDWLAARAKDLLPVPYCHVVFTIPREIGPLALQNPRILYGILFRASAEALTELAADPKRMGAKIGFIAVLHTWTQRLEHHPHVHCVVPAGGLSPNHTSWIASRKRFFLPVRPLSKLFRGKFLDYLAQAFREGRLQFHGTLHELAHPARFEDWIAPLRKQKWVVYAKPPFGGPEHVLKYLARYTHRVAIANGRLVSLEGGVVRFQWRDSQHGNQINEMALDAVEFIRRFLLHVLPCGFVKIRHYGFLSNRNRKRNLTCCRTLLPPYITPKLAERSQEPIHCPVCHVGIMRIIQSAAPAMYYGRNNDSHEVRIDSS